MRTKPYAKGLSYAGERCQPDFCLHPPIRGMLGFDPSMHPWAIAPRMVGLMDYLKVGFWIISGTVVIWFWWKVIEWGATFLP